MLSDSKLNVLADAIYLNFFLSISIEGKKKHKADTERKRILADPVSVVNK